MDKPPELDTSVSRQMKNFILIVIAAAALVTAGVVLFRNSHKPLEQKLSMPFEMLGKVLAQETLRVVDGNGKIFVLRYRNSMSAENSVLNPAAETFLKTIREAHRLSVSGVEEEAFDPYLLEEGWKNTTMDNARFLEFVEKHKEVDGIVIIGGTPQLDREAVGRLPAKRPKIITASIFTQPDRRLLNEGIIALSVVSRLEASEIRTPPKTPQEWFERRYEVWTGTDKERVP